MKTEEQIRLESLPLDADFHAVDFFRAIKEAYAKEFEGKSFEDRNALMKKYLSGELKLVMPPKYPAVAPEAPL